MKNSSLSTTRINYLKRVQAAPRQLLIGVGIMLVSSVIGSQLFRHEAHTLIALQATKSVAAGEFITLADVRRIYLPSSLSTAQWATEGDLRLPQRLIRSVRPGQPVFASDLGATASGEVVFAFESEPSTLPLMLEVGDSVQLWSVGAQDVFEAQLISSNATVVALSPVENRDSVHVTLRIAPQFLAQSIQVAAEERLRLVSSG
jgi:hypothetical protein